MIKGKSHMPVFSHPEQGRFVFRNLTYTDASETSERERVEVVKTMLSKVFGFEDTGEWLTVEYDPETEVLEFDRAEYVIYTPSFPFSFTVGFISGPLFEEKPDYSLATTKVNRTAPH